MTKLKGHIIFWEISEFTTELGEIERVLKNIGVNPEDYLPRNDYKSSLLRGLKVTLKKDKDDDRFYRRLDDKPTGVKFAVIVPKEFWVGSTLTDIEFKKEVLIELDKTTGKVTYDHESAFSDSVNDAYREAKQHLDAKQFRSLLLKLLKEECRGVALRKAGGVYYVSEADLPKLDKLRQLFEAFKKDARLEEIPIFNDASTEQAIEHAVTDDLLTELEMLRAEMIDKKMTDVILRNRREAINQLIERVNHHRDDLRSQHVTLDNKFSEMKGLIDKALVTSDDTFDLGAALAALQ